MRYIFIFLSVCLTSFSQKKILKANSITSDFKISNFESDTTNQVFLIRSNNQLDSVINSSEKNICIVYVITSWCKPCKKFLPILNKFIEINNNKIDLVLINIENDSSERLYKSTYKFLKSDFNYNRISFVIDYYKKGLNIPLYDNFIYNIVKVQHDYGLSFLGVFKNKKLVYHTASYIEDNNLIISKINEILKN